MKKNESAVINNYKKDLIRQIRSLHKEKKELIERVRVIKKETIEKEFIFTDIRPIV